MLETLKGILSYRTRQLETKLTGIAGFTGSGSFRYTLSSAGSSHYAADLRGVAGLRCELFAGGEFVSVLECRNGKVAARFDSRLGDPAIRLDDSDAIEIRQNGGIILQGTLASTGNSGRAYATRID